MPAKSTIKTLPESVKKRLDFMLAEGVLTLDQIKAWLDDQGHPRSRSAIGRHKQTIDEVGAKLRESREIVGALVSELGPAAAEGKQGRLLVEILRKLVFDQLVQKLDAKEGDEGGLEPQDFYFVAKALKDMSGSMRLDQDFELKIRTETEKRAKADAAAAVAEAGRQRGLSADQVDFIRAKILGVERG